MLCAISIAKGAVSADDGGGAVVLIVGIGYLSPCGSNVLRQGGHVVVITSHSTEKTKLSKSFVPGGLQR